MGLRGAQTPGLSNSANSLTTVCVTNGSETNLNYPTIITDITVKNILIYTSATTWEK